MIKTVRNSNRDERAIWSRSKTLYKLTDKHCQALTLTLVDKVSMFKTQTSQFILLFLFSTLLRL